MNKKIIIPLVIIIMTAISIGVYVMYSSPDAAVEIITPDETSISYKNTDYGFTFSLPLTWQGYSVVQSTWQGTPIADAAATTGPKFLVRNPNWTTSAPYEDIPVLIFTISQWDAYRAEYFSISAAPIQANELARNNKYVFALPPRWDYDYGLGYKEAQDIVAGSPLRAFDL